MDNRARLVLLSILASMSLSSCGEIGKQKEAREETRPVATGPVTAEASSRYWNETAAQVNACLQWSASQNSTTSAAEMLNSTLEAVEALPRQGVDALALQGAEAVTGLRREARAIAQNMIAAAAADHGQMAAAGYPGGGGYVGGYSAGAGGFPDDTGLAPDQAGLRYPPGQVHRRRRLWRKCVSIRDYEIHIRPLSEEEGGGYLATVPELPGCMSDGESPQEALENVFDAIACWIEAAEEMGRAVPPPRRLVA